TKAALIAIRVSVTLSSGRIAGRPVRMAKETATVTSAPTTARMAGQSHIRRPASVSAPKVGAPGDAARIWAVMTQRAWLPAQRICNALWLFCNKLGRPVGRSERARPGVDRHVVFPDLLSKRVAVQPEQFRRSDL